MFTLLVAEDDISLRTIVSTKLKQEGYDVIAVTNGAQALEVLDNRHVDLLITDIMMPDMDGFELVHLLRSTQHQLPILMMTAKVQFESLEKAFQLGVDDYVVKPIRLTELSLRVKALLRRSQLESQQVIRLAKTTLYYDRLAIEAYDSGELQTFQPKEFYVLFKLLSHPNKIFTRVDLMEEFWDASDDIDERVVDACIKRIRKKCQNYSDFDIETIRGLGYKGVIYDKK
ncbi:MAG: response regulator transcription factor [Aerococcaceae bacterium]|nr:response regulator transcription factor [Aerococcaceae bacterium]